MFQLALLPFLLVAAPAESPTFLATAAGGDGTPTQGTIVKFGKGSAILGTTSGDLTLPNVLSLQHVSKPRPPFPEGPMLITAAGDRIPGRFLGGDDRVLHFQPFLGEHSSQLPWKVPYSAVAVVWRTTPPADTPWDTTKYSWTGQERRDTIRLANGDIARGTIESVGPDVRYMPSGESQAKSIPLMNVAAIAFNPALVRARKPRESYAHVVLATGARLAVASPTIEKGLLEGKTLFGAAVRVSAADLVAVDIRQGKSVGLTELKPQRVEQTGYLGAPLPQEGEDVPRVLPSPQGDSTFDRALQIRPRSKRTYELGGKFRRFDAVVGLDASATEGSATIRVLVDGKNVLPQDRGALTPGLTRTLRLPTSGAKTLTLEVDFGPSGGVQAAVNWGEPRLVE